MVIVQPPLGAPPLDDRCAPSLRPTLTQLGLTSVEHHPDVVYGLAPDMTLGYFNPAWYAFAAANGGEQIRKEWGLGRPLVAALPDQLKPFYTQALAAARDRGLPWDFRYACSSPTELRWYTMRVLPLQSSGWLVLNTLIETSPVTDAVDLGALAVYLQESDLIVQCSHCRRVRRRETPAVWDFVPALVQRSRPEISHGLCETCLAYYYPVDDDDDDLTAAPAHGG